MKVRSPQKVVAFLYVTALSSMFCGSAYAAGPSGGVDTPTGVASLPLAVEGTPGVTITATDATAGTTAGVAVAFPLTASAGIISSQEVKVGASGTVDATGNLTGGLACTATSEGTIRYNLPLHRFEACTTPDAGTTYSWTAFNGGGLYTCTKVIPASLSGVTLGITFGSNITSINYSITGGASGASGNLTGMSQQIAYSMGYNSMGGGGGGSTAIFQNAKLINFAAGANGTYGSAGSPGASASGGIFVNPTSDFITIYLGGGGGGGSAAYGTNAYPGGGGGGYYGGSSGLYYLGWTPAGNFGGFGNADGLGGTNAADPNCVGWGSCGAQFSGGGNNSNNARGPSAPYGGAGGLQGGCGSDMALGGTGGNGGGGIGAPGITCIIPNSPPAIPAENIIGGAGGNGGTAVLTYKSETACPANTDPML